MRTIWPIFIILYHLLYSANYVFSCKNGTICGHGHMCQDNVCRECIKCALLFRKGSDCESEFNNCGPCLPGYKEISTTRFSNSVKPCRPKRLKSDVCADDDDCPLGSYCYEKFCVICFDCSTLNKLPPVNKCAKDFDQCGFCMEGFYESPAITNLSIKPCERKTQASKLPPRMVLTLNNVLPFCILLVFAAMVIKLIIRKNEARNDTTVASFERSLSPSAPPLVVPDISENVLCEEKNEKCCTVTLVTELKQQANTARIFKQPEALYYFAEEGADDASDHSNDSNENASSPPQRSEPEEACSLNIFIHRYAEIREQISPPQEMNESTRNVRQFNISIDDLDSATPSEDAAKSLPQSEDSNSPKS